MKWFSLEGIKEEIKKVRWPKKDDMVKDTETVVIFVALFALRFSESERKTYGRKQKGMVRGQHVCRT